MILVLGLIIFLGIHSVPIFAEPWRNSMVSKLGEQPWKGLYSLASLLGFVLIIYGYGQSRLDPTVIYTPPVWLRHVTMLLMIPVFPMIFAAYFPGKIKATLKHPMLVATKTWALAHLLANGTLADVLLFGGFLAWAVVDRISMKRRIQRAIPGAPPGKMNDAIAVIAGLAVYVVFVLWGHTWLIGVSPISR